MTARAISIGLGLGLLVAGFTFFNDAVIRQSWFISNHFPISVFGAMALLVLVTNPLLSAAGWRPLTVGELAVVTALGLVACGWPSFGHYWGFVPNTAMPGHLNQVQPNWRSTQVMSYVPGGSAELPAGHVRDWTQLRDRLLQADGAESQQAALGRFWSALHPSDQEHIRSMAAESPLTERSTTVLRNAINRALSDPSLASEALSDPVLPAAARSGASGHAEVLGQAQIIRVNRWLLVGLAPDLVLPPPRGEGILLDGGAVDSEARQRLVEGQPHANWLIPTHVPWRSWWPTLCLWGGLGLLLSAMSLCMVLAVHKQWAQHELLPYPVARFVQALAERSPGARLPIMAQSRLFWVGLGAMLLVHGINGLNKWFPDVPAINLTLDFSGLQVLFPNASRVDGASAIYKPYLYMTVIAFCFFINTTVSFSLGIASYLYVAVVAFLISRGMTFDREYLGAGPDNMIRFGASVAMILAVAYVGRSYYLQLLKATVGCARPERVPAYAVWSVRVLVIAMVLSVAMLHSAGSGWLISGLFVLVVLLHFLVMTRIIAETGLYFIQLWWLPIGVLTGLFGFEAIGPTNYIVLAMATIVLVGDPRTTLMPYVVNAVQMIEKSANTRPPRQIAWLALAIVLTFLVAGAATLSIAHQRGVGYRPDRWSVQTLPGMPFEQLSRHITNASIHGTLHAAVESSTIQRVAAVSIDPVAYGWMALGFALFLGVAAARLRLPWWPLHPVAFLIWGTYPAYQFAGAFILGWLIKFSIVRFGGASTYRRVLPLMVGIISGEVLAAIGWVIIGTAYFLIVGRPPESYRVFP